MRMVVFFGFRLVVFLVSRICGFRAFCFCLCYVSKLVWLIFF